MTDIYEIIKEAFPSIVEEKLSIEYIEYLTQHITLVNKYAAKLGLNFPEHDSSKYTMLFPGYRFFAKPKEQLTEEEQNILDMVTRMHIKNASHHPEYWSDDNLQGFTRANYIPNGIIDATAMPKECIDEMLCDWCAVSGVKGNTPFEWFDSVNGVRWLFSAEQEDYINNTLRTLWNG